MFERPPKISATKIILINYADRGYYKSQKNNSKSGLKKGGFDEVIEYSFKDLDKNFKRTNKKILSLKRGAGYWLWKPYIILNTLKKMKTNGRFKLKYRLL